VPILRRDIGSEDGARAKPCEDGTRARPLGRALDINVGKTKFEKMSKVKTETGFTA
jgi:hypothetical protein